MDRQIREKIKNILDAYFSGPLPTDLEEDIRSWLFYEGHEPEKEEWLEKQWHDQVFFEKRPEGEAELLESLTRLKQRLGLPPVGMPERKTIRPVWRRSLRWAAAVLVPALLIAGGALFFNRTPDAAPEKLLTEIVAGETRQEVGLPDGSQIWLQEASALSYSQEMEQEGERGVYLAGNAYFRVARDETKPFTVRTDRLDIRVLGTEFFVRAAAEEERMEVTLYTGRVEVTVEEKQYILNRREQLIYNKSDRTVELRSLPTGQLVNHRPASFEYEPLDEVFRTIEERFPVTIIGQRNEVANDPVTIRLTGGESLETILSRLRDITGTFTYEINEDQVIIETP